VHVALVLHLLTYGLRRIAILLGIERSWKTRNTGLGTHRLDGILTPNYPNAVVRVNDATFEIGNDNLAQHTSFAR